MAETVMISIEGMPRSPPQRSKSIDEFLWLTEGKPKMYSTHRTTACIYRATVTSHKVKDEAFVPRTLLIGPLQQALKTEVQELEGESWSSIVNKNDRQRYKMYMQLEKHKEKYWKAFDDRLGKGWETKLKEYLAEHEKEIRQRYAEPTEVIESDEFTRMILRDAVFIMELFFRNYVKQYDPYYFKDDMAINSLKDPIYNDLVLLENQLPYLLLERLYDLIKEDAQPSVKMPITTTFRDLTVKFFEMEDEFPGESLESLKFKHFTDLFRLAYIEPQSSGRGNVDKGQSRRSRSGVPDSERGDGIRRLYNAEKLQMSGIVFDVADHKNEQLTVNFDGKNLKIGRLSVYAGTEIRLRNIIELESHYYQPHERYVTSYVQFLGFLIDTDKDVELLADKGIIRSTVGFHYSLVKMVKNLSYGLESNSCFSAEAADLKRHYNSSWNRCIGTLKAVYFDTVWSGTATVAGVLVLVLTITQTVTSILQMGRR